MSGVFRVASALLLTLGVANIVALATMLLRGSWSHAALNAMAAFMCLHASRDAARMARNECGRLP